MRVLLPLTACGVLVAARVATTAPVTSRRACPPEQRVTTSAATGQQLALLSQALLTATVRGDPEPWRAILRDDGLFNSENGDTVSKADRIRQAVPLPSGYEATLTLTHPHVRHTPRTSVISYDAIDTERVFGQPLVTRYRYMDVYQAEAGCWFLTASETAVIPSEPAATGPLVPDVTVYDGVYRLAEAHELTVTHAGRQVYLQVGFGPRVELRPLGGDHFAIPEAPRASRIFVRDSGGRVVGLAFRRDNNDLIWRRVQ